MNDSLDKVILYDHKGFPLVVDKKDNRKFIGSRLYTPNGLRVGYINKNITLTFYDSNGDFFFYRRSKDNS